MRFKTDENLSNEVVLRLRAAVQTIPHIARMIDRLLPLLDTESLPGSLWIVDDHQVRIRPG